jgi:hypothetical protein
LDQSNYLPNQKQGTVNTYDLTVFIRPFQGSSAALKALCLFRNISAFQWIHWIVLMYLIQDFQCRVTY